MICKPTDWVDFKGLKYCKIHRNSFKTDRCPQEMKVNENELSTSQDPNISTGNLEKSKKTSIQHFTSNSQAITSNSQEVSISKRKYKRKIKTTIYERLHNYGLKFQSEVQWDALFKYPEIKLNNNVSYKRIDFENTIVKVFKKSILIILREKAEIKGLEVKEALEKADGIIKDTLNRIPQAIKVRRGDVFSIHNAFVNHPNADFDFKVIVNGETRLITDNSKGHKEFEAVSTNYAVVDTRVFEVYNKDLITNPHYLPSEIKYAIDNLISVQKKTLESEEYYAQNRASHVESIKTLASSVDEFKEVVIDFKNSIQESQRRVRVHRLSQHENSSPDPKQRKDRNYSTHLTNQTTPSPSSDSNKEYKLFRARKLLDEWGW